jgi:hypothetical protein
MAPSPGHIVLRHRLLLKVDNRIDVH